MVARKRHLTAQHTAAPSEGPLVATELGPPAGSHPAHSRRAFAQPAPLQQGDRVALFSPGSHRGRGPEDGVDQALQVLTAWGLRPEPAAAEARHLYLAGDDAHRARQFQSLYLDEGIKALFATRGGYGTARMLPLLDASAIAAAPPKAVVGMSDVCALFSYLQHTAGVGGIHGPCLAAPSFLHAEQREHSAEALRALLFHTGDSGGSPGNTASEHALQCHLLPGGPGLASGEAGAPGAPIEGFLLGGCLSVLAAMSGTPWPLQARGAIVVLEDVNEAPYRIDRYLTQLLQSGALDGARALVFGHLPGCSGDSPVLLDDMLRNVLGPTGIPVFVGLKAGHGDPNLALPLGRPAALHRRPEGASGAAILKFH